MNIAKSHEFALIFNSKNTRNYILEIYDKLENQLKGLKVSPVHDQYQPKLHIYGDFVAWSVYG